MYITTYQVPPAGFEPTTYEVEARYSIQLSYGGLVYYILYNISKILSNF